MELYPIKLAQVRWLPLLGSSSRGRAAPVDVAQVGMRARAPAASRPRARQGTSPTHAATHPPAGCHLRGCGHRSHGRHQAPHRPRRRGHLPGGQQCLHRAGGRLPAVLLLGPWVPWRLQHVAAAACCDSAHLGGGLAATAVPWCAQQCGQAGSRQRGCLRACPQLNLPMPLPWLQPTVYFEGQDPTQEAASVYASGAVLGRLGCCQRRSVHGGGGAAIGRQLACGVPGVSASQGAAAAALPLPSSDCRLPTAGCCRRARGG